MATQNTTMTVFTYGFNVPCRRFLISANVTRERRLSVVDEFYLRTLKVCERLPVSRLATYFGFSESEIQIVTSDLAARGLVEVDADNVMLHPSVHNKFRLADGDIPRITEIETWIEHVWFDLISRNIMPAERTRTSRNLIEIKADALARDMPGAFARQAFEQNFTQYMRDVRRIPNSEDIALYSISNVEAGRFGYVVVRGRDDLVVDGPPKIVPQIFEVEPGSIGRFRLLSEALWGAHRRLTMASPSVAALSEFSQLTADGSVAAAHNSEGCFDITTWYDRQQETARRDRQPVVGATYLERNIEFFVKMLEARGANQNIPKAPQLVWCRPIGTTWGASPDLTTGLSSIRGALRHVARSHRLRTTLVVPQVARTERNRDFERAFDEAYLAPAGHLSPSIEVVLLRRIGAIVTVYVKLSPDVAVPVGFVTFDPMSVAAIEKALALDGVLHVLWQRPGADEDEVEVPL